jgi:hypothetical protein
LAGSACHIEIGDPGTAAAATDRAGAFSTWALAALLYRLYFFPSQQFKTWWRIETESGQADNRGPAPGMSVPRKTR